MEKLKKLRKEYHYTIKEMAKMTGLSYTYYWQIENKKRNLYYRNAIKIAKVFGLRPDDIFYKK